MNGMSSTVSMGVGMNGIDPAMNMDMQQMMGDIMNGFADLGGEMIPSGPQYNNVGRGCGL
jgi:hypothetical protein